MREVDTNGRCWDNRTLWRHRLERPAAASPTCGRLKNQPSVSGPFDSPDAEESHVIEYSFTGPGSESGQLWSPQLHGNRWPWNALTQFSVVSSAEITLPHMVPLLRSPGFSPTRQGIASRQDHRGAPTQPHRLLPGWTPKTPASNRRIRRRRARTVLIAWQKPGFRRPEAGRGAKKVDER